MSKPVVIVSGGFDPVHAGHIEMFDAAAQIGSVVVLLNSDAWLTRKKSRPFMNFEQRSTVLSAIDSVTSVQAVDDSDGTVCEGIRSIYSITRFNDVKLYFANGGDRNASNTPEQDLCRELGVELLWGIGGQKISSSSNLLKNYNTLKHDHDERPWGHFDVLYKDEAYQVKKLCLIPNTPGISLQYHNHRTEVWTIADGTADVKVGDKHLTMHKGETIEVPVGEHHKIKNIGSRNLVVIETQFGDYLDESDIVRLEDPYDR